MKDIFNFVGEFFWFAFGWILTAFIRVPIAYCQGLWFLIAHPLMFVQSMKLYEAHRRSIEDKEHLIEAGYFNLNRSERRKLLKRV